MTMLEIAGGVPTQSQPSKTVSTMLGNTLLMFELLFPSASLGLFVAKIITNKPTKWENCNTMCVNV